MDIDRVEEPALVRLDDAELDEPGQLVRRCPASRR
jgi:hypothetical protein